MIYPKSCILCGQILDGFYEGEICEKCSSRLGFIQGKTCIKCGKPREHKHEQLCYDCSHKAHAYTAGKALWTYNEVIKKGIAQYKFYNQKNSYKFFGDQMLLFYIQNTQWKIDLITSVPLHKEKERKRTYNQSGLLASYLGESLNIPVNNQLLVRTRNTAPQKELSDEERKENVNNAFKIINKDIVPYKNILLIDDIYTTGCTIDGCAKVLKKNGAGEIYFLTLAIGEGF